MAVDFSIESEFQERLDWVNRFVRDDVEPLDVLFPGCEYLPLDDTRRAVVDPLKQQVRDHGLWACHLGPELGGQGYGAVKLTLLNEILGRSGWSPIVFGTQAPDTGNAEILARFGTDDQKARYLQPLLDGEIFSCFSMTEPQGGSDPALFTTRALRDGDEWVIEGTKYFSSNATVATFLIVMAVTDPDVAVHRGTSMFLVPADTPGIEIDAVHHLYGSAGHEPGHALVRYDRVRVPADALLGEEGRGFAVAQSRLSGGRIHHAMRTIGMCQRALDMLCERALSRTTRDGRLADKQFVQGFVADSYAQLVQFRLTVLHTAWLIDQGDERAAITQIGVLKTLIPKVLHDIVGRTIQVHGALGTTTELPLMGWLTASFALGLADGPTEVHRANLARHVLADHEPTDRPWPTEFREYRQEQALERYGDTLGEGFDSP
jgi:alkylation response protein AidB-like acyl-CoA dehydrogenase